jgi:parallel beta-helix repeat protein
MCGRGVAIAATLQVNNGVICDDDNPSNPYCTIQVAIDDANGEDEVLVHDGTYVENIRMGYVSVRSKNGPEVTVIDGSNPTDPLKRSVVTFNINTDHELDGFKLVNGTGYNNDYLSPTTLVGGGIYCGSSSSPTIINCIVSGNTATSGGGIYCSSSSPTITNCIIKDNSAIAGAGIYFFKSSPAISNCIVSGNTATSLAGSGGGISCFASSPKVTGCIIKDNKIGIHGGGVECSSNMGSSPCLPKFINCIISGNTAGYNNNIGSGGGFHFWTTNPATKATLINCTVSGNNAFSEGGGINSANVPLTVVNSIIWGNIASSSENEIYKGVNISIIATYSNIKGGWPGTGNIGNDLTLHNPLFVSSASGDYHLKADSPCIDAGTNDIVAYPNLPIDDIDGDSRPQDGNGDDLFKYDIGSYELPEVPSPLKTLIPAGTIIAFAAKADKVPDGWLFCDGREILRSVYQSLFNMIGTAHGDGDGSATFNLPDYRGFFLRGVDHGAGNDTDSAKRIPIGPDPPWKPTEVGSKQDDATKLPNNPLQMSELGSHHHDFTSNAGEEHNHGLNISDGGDHRHESTHSNGDHKHDIKINLDSHGHEFKTRNKEGNHYHFYYDSINKSTDRVAGSIKIDTFEKEYDEHDFLYEVKDYKSTIHVPINDSQEAISVTHHQHSGISSETIHNHTGSVETPGPHTHTGSTKSTVHNHDGSTAGEKVHTHKGITSTVESQAPEISGGDSETRPKNKYVNWIVKY